jgi:hypothetical protein
MIAAENNNTESQWKRIYLVGGIFAILSLFAVILDIVIGSSLGGDLTTLPQTAVDRFAQFQVHPWLGLYNLDLLNAINQIISIPVYFVLYSVHRKTNQPFALLALIIFLIGTTIFITNNAALPMFELSNRYAVASESQKVLIAADGEGLLARGAHGSLGVFLGFALSLISTFLMSLVMLQGKIFGKITSYPGVIGNILMFIYILLVTFFPSSQSMAMTLAMPGGLLSMAWMILFTIKLFKLSAIKE